MNKVIAVVLSADAASFKTEMLAASGAVKEFESSAKSSGDGVSKWGMAVKAAAMVAVIALAAASVAVVSMAAGFDRAMRNVNSISQLSESGFKGLEQSVLDLSKTVPQSATTLAQGLYDIASSGFQGAQGMTVLTASAKAATAGLSDTKTAAQAIVGVLNAYGLAADQSAHVSDVLFQTVNVGVLSFSDLARGLGEVIGIGSAAKVSINELGAAVAGMTLAGVPADQAFTELNRVILSFVKPTSDMTNLMHSLGYESAFTALQTLGLHGVMEKLRVVTGGNVETLTTLFGDVRAGRGAFALMTADGQNYARAFAAVTDETQVAGSTQRAFAEQMKSLSAQWDLFTNRISAGAIQVGLVAIPTLVAGLAGAQHGIESLVTAGQAIGRELNPFFTGVVDAAVSLGHVVGNLASDFAPLGRALAIIAGSAVVVTLNGMATALAALAGFLEQNSTLVEIVATLIGGYLVASLAAAAFNAGVLASEFILMRTAGLAGIVQEIALRVMYLSDALVGVGGAGTYVTSLKAAFSGLGGVLAGLAPLLAGTAIVGSAVLITTMFDKADKAAKQLVADVTKNVQPNSITTITSALDDLRRQLAAVTPATGPPDPFSALYDSLFDDSNERANSAAKAIRQKISDLEGQFEHIHTVVTPLMEQFQLPFETIVKFADKAGINLSTLAAKDIPWAALQMQAFVTSANGGTVATDSLTSSFQMAADATESATDRVKGYKDALDALIGIHLSVFDANTKLAKSMTDLSTTIAGTGINLDQSTKAGQAFRDSLSGSVSSATDLAKALADESGIPAGVKSLQDFRDQLAGVLTQSGMSKDAVDLLLTSLGLTDQNFVAELSLNGADTAKTTVDGLNAGLDIYGNQKPTATPQVDAAPAKASIDSVQALLLQYSGANPNTVATLDIGPAQAKFDALRHDGGIYEQSRPMTVADLEAQAATLKFQALQHDAGVFESTHPVATADVDTQPATTGLAQWLVDNSGHHITIHLNTDAPVLNPNLKTQRWGGIVEHAATGLVRFGQANIYNSPVTGIAETGTGGEAFIPRHGITARSLAILNQAASWYGMAVVDTSKKRTLQQPLIGARPVAMAGGAYMHVTVEAPIMVNVPNYVGSEATLVGAISKAMGDSHGQLVRATSDALRKHTRART